MREVLREVVDSEKIKLTKRLNDSRDSSPTISQRIFDDSIEELEAQLSYFQAPLESHIYLLISKINHQIEDLKTFHIAIEWQVRAYLC